MRLSRPSYKMTMPHLSEHSGQYRRWLAILFLFAFCISSANVARAAEVIVVGDTRLKPVVEVIAGIRSTMKRGIEVYNPSEVRSGNLSNIVNREEARAVITLGQEPLEEALSLPPEITVLYALVILPPKTSRENTAGIYMGTPIKEYLRMVDSYLPGLKQISTVGSPEILEVLDNSNLNQLTTYKARTAFDFVTIVKDLDSTDALLLLPDISLLTKTALEESYLFSFREKVPLLGISKKHVRQGALFALEFEPEEVGRRLGIMALEALNGKVLKKGLAQASESFSLYINRKTAQKMGIIIPDEMIKIAAGVYP